MVRRPDRGHRSPWHTLPSSAWRWCATSRLPCRTPSSPRWCWPITSSSPRSAPRCITADPYHPRRLRLTVSGPAPIGPATADHRQPAHPPGACAHPRDRHLTATQSRRSTTDLAWQDAPAGSGTLHHCLCLIPPGWCAGPGQSISPPCPKSGQYRVLVREYEYLSANYTIVTRQRAQDRHARAAETADLCRNRPTSTSRPIGGPGGTTGTTL